MSIPIIRRTTPWLAGAAVLAGTLAAAAPANAATYYACVKKSGAAKVFTKKPKCRKGEKTISWNAIGPAGANGRNGANGTNGTNGAKGEAGAPGGFFGVLPSGKMMLGTFAAQGPALAAVQYRTGVSFLLSLPSPIKAPNIHFIEVGEAVPSGCGGTVAAPIAAPGNLCIFEGVSRNNTANRGEVNPVTDEAPDLSMPVFGFGVYAECEKASSECVDEGTWAVTA